MLPLQRSLLKVAALGASMLASGLGGLSWAQEEGPVEPLEGLDPVLLVEGREVQGEPGITVARGRFRYSFAGEETRRRFEADPERYEIRYGGACARMRSADGNPDLFAVHDGGIYVFGSAECWRAFRAAPTDYLDRPPAPLGDDPAASERGRQLIERAVAAVGGAAVVDAVRVLLESGTIPPPGGSEAEPIPVTLSFELAGRARQDAVRSFGPLSMILNADGLFQVTRFGVERRLDYHRLLFERELARHPLALLAARTGAGFRAVALPPPAGGGTVERVAVDTGGQRLVLALDAGSGLPASLAFDGQGPDWRVGEVEVVYSDYRAVDGLLLPFRREGRYGGGPFPARSFVVESARIDPELPPDLFAPPQPETGDSG